MTATPTGSGAGASYRAATDEHASADKRVYATGKVSGHGVGAWLPAPSYLATSIPQAQPLPDGLNRAVVILDTGIRRHARLELPGHPQPTDSWFQPPWDDAPAASERVCPHDHLRVGGETCFGSHSGHASFLASIVRREAHGAGLISYRIMDDDGAASDERVVKAVHDLVSPDTLALLAEQRLRPTVVLMAFGRAADPTDDGSELKQAIRALAEHGVRTVIAAGNDGTDRPQYPAAFAADPDLNAVAVGGLADSPDDRAPFSSFGPWVTAWRYATNIIGAMPLQLSALPELPGPPRPEPPPDCYAWWSGTSFAAAQYAGQLVADPDGQIPDRPPPRLPEEARTESPFVI